MNSLFSGEWALGSGQKWSVCALPCRFYVRSGMRAGGGKGGLRVWERRKRWRRVSCGKGVKKWALGEGGALASRGVGLVVNGWGREQAGLAEVDCKESLGKAASLREVPEGPFLYMSIPFWSFSYCLRLIISGQGNGGRK